MADTASPTPVAPATPTKAVAKKGKATPKKGAAKAKKHAPSHPKVSDMVNSAILTLKERGGSSLIAIKKHIAGHYKVDVEKLAPFIKKYIKSAVTNGTLVQTKGTGASGSFKLGAKLAKKDKKTTDKPKEAKPKKPAGEKTKKAAAKPKKTSPKKAAKATKKASPKKPKSPKKAKSPKKVSAPKKEKKAKTPKKTKSPKPKKAAAKKPAKK